MGATRKTRILALQAVAIEGISARALSSNMRLGTPINFNEPDVFDQVEAALAS